MKAKPFTGAILGVVLGLAVAVILQQQGVWPLDRLTFFFLPAILGFLVLLLLTMGKEASVATFIIALIILVPMAVWGALGFGNLNEKGELNGGCTVDAVSTAPDTTTVTDTSKQDPFKIDPDGGLKWAATSPVVFNNYDWKIWVDVGGVPVTIESEKSQNNDGGSQINAGDVANITTYAKSKGIPMDQLRGVFKVGGDASSMTCEGFAYVTLLADPFETLASQIALAVVIIILIFIIVLMILGRGGKAAAAGAAAAGSAAASGDDGDVPGDPTPDTGLASEIAAAAAASGYGSKEDLDKLPSDDLLEIEQATIEIEPEEDD